MSPGWRLFHSLTGFPGTEVIIQKKDRYPFDHQIRQTGAKLVEVETREEMIAAINPRTVAIHFCPQSTEDRSAVRKRSRCQGA